MVMIENLVDSILKVKFKKYQIPIVKRVLKSLSFVSIEINIDFTDDEDVEDNIEDNIEDNDEMSNVVKSVNRHFKEIIKEYKDKGYSKGEIIEELDKCFEKYNINMDALPTLVYRVYDD